MMVEFVQSPNYYRGRLKPLRLVVWHDMETDEYGTAAEDVARNWFAKTTARVSAHICVDNNSIVECVKPGDTAWAAPNANADGYQIELAGRANQTREQWLDAFSASMLKLAAQWVRTNPALRHIPPRWLTDAQLADGVTAGHVTHAQCSRVLGGNHYDPGKGFPADYLMSLLQQSEIIIGGFLMALTDKQQEEMYYRVMYGIPAGSAKDRFNPDGSAARVFDSADGDYLRQLLEVVAGKQLTPEAIAASIPTGLAQAVIDALADKLSGK